MKILRNVKFINIFCYTFCALYFAFAIAYSFAYVLTENQIESDFNALSAYVEQMNNQWAKEQIEINYDTKEETSGQTEQTYEILYTDGKTALIDGYSKLYNASSFYARIQGIISGDAMGFNIRFNFDDTAVRFSENKCYNELMVKYLDTTAPSALKGLIEDQAKFAQKNLKDWQQYRRLITNDVQKVGNNLVATYNGTATRTGAVDMVPDNLLIINEETIKKVTYFKTKIKKGLPVYTVQAELDPQKATKDFVKVLNFNMDGVYLGDVTYSSCIVTAIIDHTGQIIGMTSNDSVNCLVSIPGYIDNMTLPCKYSLSYAFNSVNKDITFKPKGF